MLRAPGPARARPRVRSGEIEVDDIDAALELLDGWQPPPLDARGQGPDRARRACAPARCARVPRVPRAELRPQGPAPQRSRATGARSRHHYDVSNEFFALFLDESMTYSCAILSRGAKTLEEAQDDQARARLHEARRCEPGERVLDVGCGWGAFALHAAREHGVHVTGITLSRAAGGAGARARARRPGSPTGSTSASWTTASSPASRSTRSPRSAWSSTSAASNIDAYARRAARRC